MKHELDRQIDYVRAALQQDRRPLALLLGAGAPMAVRPDGQPIVPDIAGLTSAVRTEVNEPERTVVVTCLDELTADAGRPATVEQLLDYLRRLSAIPGSGEVRGLTHGQIAEADAAVCAVIGSKLDVQLPANETPYDDVGLWSRAALRHAPLEVFTTNYDLLLEQALERCSVPYFDGFVGSYRPSFDLHALEEDILPDRWVRLWKLHGSVNWTMNEEGLVRRCFPTDKSERTLIYPSHLKYDQSRRLPYLALLDRLRSFLRQPGAVLISCGFAFRDEHINDVVGQALRANATAAVLALQFDPQEAYTEGTRLALTTPNFSLLTPDAAVVGAQLGDWEAAESSAFDLGDFARFGRFLRGVIGANGATPQTTVDTTRRDSQDD